MAQRQSRRLHGLDAEIVPETARDKHCVFCLTDENQGFNIIGGNFMRFPCCKKFAHRSCQREWGRNLPLYPQCQRKLDDELPPLQGVIQDREGLERRINAVRLTFSYIHVSFKVDLTTTCVQ